jgi:uncharacterized SAM-binding protein YcdF (DUF218 family)
MTTVPVSRPALSRTAPQRVILVTYRLGLAVVAGIVVYLGVTMGQVWLASRRDQARPSQAIIVLGAAEYNGRPSQVLKSRLDHAADLYSRHLAPLVVVTGGRQPGDRFTEAEASANYLSSRGIPDAQILREDTGRTSYQSLEAASRFLHQRHIRQVLLVSDPFHSERLIAMSGQLGLSGFASPTRSSPIRGAAVLPYMGRETVALAAGRILGFGRLGGLEHKTPA